MTNMKVTKISVLLSRRRPISGTVSLTHHRETTVPTTSSIPNSQNPNSTTSAKIIKSLIDPSSIIGVLSLPNTHTSLPHSSFSISDDSASVCCDVIDFDIFMIGRKIVVLSWNFVPFKKCGGLLEIIDWKFLDDSHFVIVDSFPLNSNYVGESDFSKAKYSVNGVVNSVSPLVIVPCSVGLTAEVAENVQGFIVEIVNCDHLDEGEEVGRTQFVYFSGMVSCWHPAFLKLVGKGISLSRLKKKLVYIGKEGVLMYVTSKGTQLGFVKLKDKGLSCRKRKREVEGKGETGVYVGVVKGVFMQGMIVELDDEVWLLMTEESPVLQHSVRVGTVLSVRNVHFMNLKFRWGKVLVLGACSRTNIRTMSSSPMETGCFLVSESQSLLRKFINSLVFPARLWVLLLVQCFRRKFSQVYTEKVILGTKHNEGLVQSYARSVLPSSVYQSHHGKLMDFCKHDSCGSSNDFCYGSVSLAVPFSNFLHNCDRIWMKYHFLMKNGLKMLEGCKQDDQPMRKILTSKDIGVSLVGTLKISKGTGRLEFTDATGGIDAVIPDLPPAWNTDAIYEVIDYSLVLEGMPEMCSQMRVRGGDDFFSCSSIFRSTVLERQAKVTVYVHFLWSNLSCKYNPVRNLPSSKDTSADIYHGSFHLIYVNHKFPMQSRFQGDLIMTNNCHLFAEVVVLPWVLNVASGSEAACPEKVSQGEAEHNSRNGFAVKRCETQYALNCFKKVGVSNFEVSGNIAWSKSSYINSLPQKKTGFHSFCPGSPVRIPCTASFRGMDGQSVAISGVLSSTEDVDDSAKLTKTSLRKLLLEFHSEYMFKYKLTHIGSYYIVKHSAGKCFCCSDDKNQGGRVVINVDIPLWRMSFDCEVPGSNTGNAPSLGSGTIPNNMWYGCLQKELLLHAAGATDCGSFSDVTLHIAGDAIGPLNVYLKAVSEYMASLSASLATIQKVGSRTSVVGIFQNQGTHSGNGLPEGDLISLRGTVVSLYHSSCSSGHVAVDKSHIQKFSREWKSLIDLHVLIEGHVLHIGGCLSKHEFPVGLAPGADVTFHRILALSEQRRLILTPVSFITVNSVKETSMDSYLCYSFNEEAIVSCSISDLMQRDTCKLKRLRCRVVGVHIVIMERNKILDKVLASFCPGTALVNIPIAGFILDDGSSLCYCWASGERAEALLRLHEEVPQLRSGCQKQRLKNTVAGMSYRMLSAHLNNILKRHGRIVVKTFGSIHDNVLQNFHASVVSGCIFGTQDENLLKLMISNACSSNFWTLTGHVMDSNGVGVVEKYLLQEEMALRALQNVWVKDVSQVDTLTEARALFQVL